MPAKIIFSVVSAIALILVLSIFFFLMPKKPSPQPSTLGFESTPSKQNESKNPTLSVGLRAQFFSDTAVNALLKPGDMLLQPTIRNQTEIPLSADNFNDSINILNGLNTSEDSVNKNIVFSSVQDLRNFVSLIPVDISWVSYDMERNMTPAAEIDNPTLSVQQFADIAHTAGKKMAFGPTHVIFDGMENRGTLSQALKYTDMVIYQGQNVLPAMNEKDFIKLIQEKYAYVQSSNQANDNNVKFYLQLWDPQQPPETMIRVFSKLSNLKAIDYAGVGGVQSTTDITTVLNGLRS